MWKYIRLKASTFFYIDKWMNEWMNEWIQQIYIFTREINTLEKKLLFYQKRKIFFTFFIMKHKWSPKAFLQENKMIHDDQISSFFDNTAKRQYFWLFLIANAKACIICLTAIVKMCSISYSIFKCFYLTHFFTLIFSDLSRISWISRVSE